MPIATINPATGETVKTFCPATDEEVDATIARAYEQAGAADRFSYYIEEGAGHVLSDEMWRRARAWFRTHLS